MIDLITGSDNVFEDVGFEGEEARMHLLIADLLCLLDRIQIESEAGVVKEMAKERFDIMSKYGRVEVTGRSSIEPH